MTYTHIIENMDIRNSIEEMPRTDVPYHTYFDLLKDKHDRRALLASNLALGFNCGTGDCQVTPNELPRSNGGYDRFVSILDQHRHQKKMAEKLEYELKPTFKPDNRNVKECVEDLVDKLKTQFGNTKQARKRQIAKDADYAKHIWNNSVDSFLRRHEKPKLDIKYHEGDGDHPGEGVYTFAVRPDRIRRRFTEANSRVSTEPCDNRLTNKDIDIETKMFSNAYDINASVPIHQEPPIDKVTAGKATLDDLEISIADDNRAEYCMNHESVCDVTEDEYDDDSPFGILSVYCRSELHSGYGPEKQCSGLRSE